MDEDRAGSLVQGHSQFQMKNAARNKMSILEEWAKSNIRFKL